MQTVVIVQEVLPDYRVGFFERLRDELRNNGIDLELFHASAGGERSMHGDEARLPWARLVPTRRLTWAGRSVVWTRLGREAHVSDLVIVEHASRHLVNYVLLARSWFGGAPVAFWGHGADLQARPTGLLAAWKRRTATLPAWWFAYTNGSAERVRRAGFPDDRICVVQNSAPTVPVPVGVRRDSDRVCFVGSLHAHKRLDFLLRSIAAMLAVRPSLRVDIVGEGPLRHQIEAFAAKHSSVTYLGRRVGAAKAATVASSVLMLNPGLVGLGVIDSFACATPMVTIAGDTHSPEFEYLEDGRNSMIMERGATPESYGSAVVSLMASTERLTALQEGCRVSAGIYTVDAMVDRFARGVVSFLATRDPASAQR